MTRETVSKRITANGIKPCGERRGYPVYKLRDVANFIGDSVQGDDPNEWAPKDRLDHYKAENERIKMERELGKLIPAEEIEQQLATTFKRLVLTLDTMPDVMERDAGLNNRQIEYCVNAVDGMRNALYQSLVGEEAEAEE